jgi:hypothetical protein
MTTPATTPDTTGPGPEDAMTEPGQDERLSMAHGRT